MFQSHIRYLSVMCTNWAGASEGTVGITLLRVRKGVVLHFIVPGLHMERRRTIPREVSKHISYI